MTMAEWEHHSGLQAVLSEAQRRGSLGRAPIEEVIRHSMAFAEALPSNTRTCVDVGTGAGVPGLVIAVVRPEVEVTLVDRREKRTDALHRATRALGIASRTEVVCTDAEMLVDDPAWASRFDAAVSRGFGPPVFTLTTLAKLVRPGGVVVISEPPIDTPSRWPEDVLRAAGVSQRERRGPVSMFHVEHHE
jgi:16S rRNA (guanine527-N7)-methyltransferase